MTDPHDALLNRRSVLQHTMNAFALTGAGFALWPLIDQMNPNSATPRTDLVETDLKGIAPGQTVTVAWRGMPVLIRHRTREEIAQVRRTPLDLLPDGYARNAMLPETAPATDVNRVLAGFEQWLVVIGLCTHLGCRLPQEGDVLRDGAGTGWFCPCHAASFDASGRVRAGPARTNLAVPRYAFLEPLRIRIG